MARRTDEREEPVPLSVEQLVQRGIGSIALAVAAPVLPWVAAVHVHAVAILLAPALLTIRLLGHCGRRATAVVVGAATATVLAAGAYSLELLSVIR
jgi:hypothetical protein